MTRIVVRTVPGGTREECREYLRRHIPMAEFCVDNRYSDTRLSNEQKASLNFYRALQITGDDACVHMEDDVWLAKDFCDHLWLAIDKRPDSVVQFFSMRKADIEIGSRWDNNFIMAQCFYLPPGYSRQLAAYFPTWPKWDEHPGGLDMMVNDWLRSRQEKYWIHVPNLVDHRSAPSIINPRRPRGRQSKTFQGPAL